MRTYLRLLTRLWANWITLLGAILTTLAALAILILFTIEVATEGANIYTSTFLVLFLPVLFAVGLVLIPAGLWIDRRRRRRSAAASTDGLAPEDPVEAAFLTAFRDRSARRRVLFVALVTVVNIVIFSIGGTKAVTYMDSPRFCGTTCHTVMQPEWDAYNRSHHARVACVECHIGPGASWAVKAKVNGLHQVWAVLTKSYARPVPSPVEHMRPSHDTCEQCHWPGKFTGGRIKIFPHYKPDRDNTPTFNVQLLRVGGQNPKTHRYEGIHWHVAPDEQVRYEHRDRERTKIGKITVLEKGQVKRVYEAPGEPVKPMGERLMDCVDCHNRPAHVYDLGPREAIDRAIWEGRLDAKMPYLVEIARDLLVKANAPREGAQGWFRKAVADAYRAKSDARVEPAAIEKAADEMARMWLQNNYPAMKVGWRTYRSHLGHEDEAKEVLGCYRCHDKEHVAKLPDGSTKTLSQECDLCHEAIATEKHPDQFEAALQAFMPLE